MDEIIAFIADLIERGFAYAVEGDVYFRVSRFEEYGRLSGQRPDQVEEQEPNPLKEDPRDFALWKANKPDEDTAWDSPWGRGRPGWHIECSAMAELLLGPSFEIHGGGLDLVFPHHENEVAQSRARGHEFARIWMHNGMLRFTGEKMSKSVGNVATIKEVLDEWGPETRSLFFLTARWSSPIDFSEETMEGARARAEGIREIFRNPSEPAPADAWERFEATLDDDFNTPDALALVHEWRDHDLVRRALDVFGLASLAVRTRRRPSSTSWRAGGSRRERSATSRRPIACGPRSRPPAGTCGTIRTGTAWFRSSDARAGVRPQGGSRGSAGAARGARAVGDRTSVRGGVVAQEGPRVQVKLDRDIGEAAGTRDHQGVLAWCEPYRYADAYELAAADEPLLACLDQVTDPHNLGAVCRTARARRRRA